MFRFLSHGTASLAACAIAGAVTLTPGAPFRLTTFTSGLEYPDQMILLTDGSLAIATGPNGGTTGAVLRFIDSNGDGVADGPGTPLYQTPTGPLTGFQQIGKYFVLGNYGDHTITLLAPGATPDAQLNPVGTLQFSYPEPYEHDSIGIAIRPTPAVTGSLDLVFNVGSATNDQPTTVQVQLSGMITATLDGDSLYAVSINENGPLPTAYNLRKVAAGIRNVAGMQFDASGNLWFADNAIDNAQSGTGDEPPQADELNFIAAQDIGTTVPNFGFPTCYIQYRTGIPVGSGCVQPVIAFQPLPNGTQLGSESEGPAGMALAPAGFPSGFNRGIFIGFYGKHVNGTSNEENAVVYCDPRTGRYLHFVENSQPDVGHLDGLLAAGNALYMSDFGTGNVYRVVPRR
ncbi:MAG: hypothetical protein C5B51_07105 [Terriglobia bacterium]|nr:MAG: hypothetical protein C5B51_07105 [Terriglobia bacterium]